MNGLAEDCAAMLLEDEWIALILQLALAGALLVPVRRACNQGNADE